MKDKKEKSNPTKDKEVDLYTTDRELDNFMLTEYPGKIKEKPTSDCDAQYVRDTSDPDQTVYQFRNLKWHQLEPFLDKHVLGYEYEIRDSKTGNIIRVSGDNFSNRKYNRVKKSKK